MKIGRRVVVTVDGHICDVSGTCVMVDPTNFDLVDGKSQAPTRGVVMTEELSDAILDCPVQAISFVDA